MRYSHNEADRFEARERSEAFDAQFHQDTPAARFGDPGPAASEMDEALLPADSAEQTAELAGLTDADKDNALVEIGFKLAEHPLAGPCRACGYRRRYAAMPDRCLWCEALN